MTARPSRLLASLVLLGLLAASACDSEHLPGEPQSSITSSADAQLTTASGGAVYVVEPERLPVVTVDHVIDGDTLVTIDDGRRERVRAYGMAAPEADERCGPEATARLVELAGTRVLVLTDRRLEDQFGRQLRYLFASDGRSIEAALIQEGLARAWHDDGAYRARFVELEATARTARRGCLWSGS